MSTKHGIWIGRQAVDREDQLEPVFFVGALKSDEKFFLRKLFKLYSADGKTAIIHIGNQAFQVIRAVVDKGVSYSITAVGTKIFRADPGSAISQYGFHEACQVLEVSEITVTIHFEGCHEPQFGSNELKFSLDYKTPEPKKPELPCLELVRGEGGQANDATLCCCHERLRIDHILESMAPPDGEEVFDYTGRFCNIDFKLKKSRVTYHPKYVKKYELILEVGIEALLSYQGKQARKIKFEYVTADCGTALANGVSVSFNKVTFIDDIAN